MTSHANFGQSTHGTEVTKAFASQVTDKIVLITGVSAGGIGGSTAWSLAAHSPKLLLLTGRQRSRVQEVIDKINQQSPNVTCKFVELDLSSQQSVRAAANKILDDSDIPHINIIINNAGVMNLPKLTHSPEGIEAQFATNHIGHFLLTNLLMPKLLTAAASAPTKGATRVINVSSRAIIYSPVRLSDPNFTKFEKDLPQSEHAAWQNLGFYKLQEPADTPYTPQTAYGQSKTANALFSRALTRRLYDKHGILSIGLHPGFIITELGRHMDPEELKAAMEKFKSAIYAKNTEEGCSTSLVAALDPKLDDKVDFMADCQLAGSDSWVPKYAVDDDVADRLWSLSEELTGEKFTYENLAN